MSRSDPSGDRPSLDRSAYAAIRHQLATRDVRSHLALFYRSRVEKRTAATAFVDLALHDGWRCLYVLDESDRGQLERQFRAVGIDVEGRTAAGDLRLAGATEMYVDGFDPQGLVDKLERLATESVEAGYEGLAVAGENTWSFELEESFDGIIEFEAAFDCDCESVPARTLCQYNLERFDETAIVKALRTHEHLVYRGTLCENPYYIPPEEYLDAAGPETNAEAILEQTYSLSESRQAVAAHRQRLEVINRIFRHNIRNDMNVLLSYLDLLEEEDHVDEAACDMLETMRGTLEGFIETTERARYIEQTLRDSALRSLDLVALVADVTDRLAGEYPEAAFEVSAPPSVRVVADGNIDVAIEELCRNGVVHADADAPTVRVAVGEADVPGSATLTVESEGGPIPDAVRRAISEGVETPLQHSSGLGLWLVKWLVDASHGQLEFVDTADGRSRIRLLLPTAAHGHLQDG